MKKEIKIYKVADLELNSGQLGWLPRNPRQWTRQDIDQMAASIKEDPDFIQDRPPLVVPLPGKKGKAVVFAHNLWTSAAKDGKLVDEVSCYVYTPENDADRQTIVRRALKDNGTFGSWDWDILANEWPTEQATAWGVPAWDTDPGEGEATLDDFGTDFSLPDGEKDPFRQVSFQLSDEMAEILLLAVKAAQYSEDFINIVKDSEPQNENGIGAYILAKKWLDENLAKISDADFDKAQKDAEELRHYLRLSLKESGKTAADVDRALGTSGMSGHYFGASQWMFPTRAAYEKMREFMPLPRDWFECKAIEMRYNLQKYLKQWEELKTSKSA